MALSEYLLEFKNIIKDYYGNRVLKGVSLSLKEGEIHALIGENGAGKSTLMNVLFGMPVIHQTGGFSGEILIGGEKVVIGSPHDAMNAGIGMVHQEFMLLPGFTITENIKLNREITDRTMLSRIFGHSLEKLNFQEMSNDTRNALGKLSFSIDENSKVSGLPVGYMQFIEIARELDKKTTKILILDEPTAVLTESEADKLLSSMRLLADSGIAILFITHRLDEVMTIADRITCLRDGEVVGSMAKSETSIDAMAEMMVGRPMENLVLERDSSVKNTETMLKIKDFYVNMPGEKVTDMVLDIYKGEILGLGGLAGQGKIGVANGIMGHYKASGEIKKENLTVKLNDTSGALNAGMAFVSEDRRSVGLLLDQSIEFNIASPSIQSQKKFLMPGPFGILDRKKIREHAIKMIKELDIRCTGPWQPVKHLSGGNQQKVCIAKALTLNPNLLFVSEPTRGIDIGAKKIVLDLLVKLNREIGVTVVVTSSELAELRAICDRIAIVYDGRIGGILAPDAEDRDFGILLAGGILKSKGVEAHKYERE